MNDIISPKYRMKLVKEVSIAIWAEYKTYKEVRYYINKWYVEEHDTYNNSWSNFDIVTKENGEIDTIATLHNIDEKTIIQIAIDLGVDTPDFIPCSKT